MLAMIVYAIAKTDSIWAWIIYGTLAAFFVKED